MRKGLQGCRHGNGVATLDRGHSALVVRAAVGESGVDGGDGGCTGGWGPGMVGQEGTACEPWLVHSR